MAFLRSAQIGRGYDHPNAAVYSSVGVGQSIAVGPDGTIFALVSPETNVSSITAVYHSTDQGATWVRTGTGGPYGTNGVVGSTRGISVSANNVVFVANAQQWQSVTYFQAGIWNGSSISWGSAVSSGFGFDTNPFVDVIVRPHTDPAKRATSDLGVAYTSGTVSASAFSRVWFMDINRTTGAISNISSQNLDAANYRGSITWDHTGDGLTPRNADTGKFFLTYGGNGNSISVRRFIYTTSYTADGAASWSGTGMDFQNASGWCWSDGTNAYCRGWDRGDPTEEIHIFQNGWDSAMTAQDAEYRIDVAADMSASNGMPSSITYRSGTHWIAYGNNTGSPITVRLRTWTPGGGASAVLMSEVSRVGYFGGVGGAQAVPASAPVLFSMAENAGSGSSFWRGHVADEALSSGFVGWGMVPM